MGYILVTNDDGVDSPALVPLVRALRELGPVRVAVPDTERSWIGKAISRWHEIRVQHLEREGIAMVAVGGYPADCTNLGVYSLFEGRPDLVVSGVNIGLNSGLGFFLSSGTIGAAMEGWIAGIPALAFSVGVQGHDREWKTSAVAPESHEIWQRAAALAADITRAIQEGGFPVDADLLSVNFPVGAGPETPRALTELAAVGYRSLFRRKSEDVFVHDYTGELRNEANAHAATDVAALREGRVSITPVRLAHTAKLSPEHRRVLVRASDGAARARSRRD